MKEMNFESRLNPILVGKLKGIHLIHENVITNTRKVLERYSQYGVNGHEGLVYWAGKKIGDGSIVTTVCIPKTDHGPQRVIVEGKNLAKINRAVRSNSLIILHQIHSHPGRSTVHSDGDDNLILFPKENMLSVVISNYGRNFNSINDASIHQFRNGQWMLCDDDSCRESVIVIPSKINTLNE